MVQSLRELSGASPSKAVIKDSVLVIIDAQNEYVDGHLKTANVSSTRQAILTLLTKYRAANSSVIHVVHDTPASAPIFTPGTPLAEVFPELHPYPNNSHEAIIHKQHPGSFTGTNLEQQIKQTGKKQLVLVGYMAHVCVSTTARQAAERGYDVILAKGAIGDRDIPGVDAGTVVDIVLKELGDAFGTVVGFGDVA